MALRFLPAALAALLLAACSSGPEAPDGASPTTPSRSSAGTPETTSTPEDADFDAGRVNLELRPVADGLEAPLAITHAGDGSGRIFVAEQGGRVVAIDPERGTTREFLDLSDRTEAEGEQGLLGLAFHPEFEDNGRLFVNYTDDAGDTVIAEYSASATRADDSSHQTILTFDQPFANHNGGQLAFGPDGYLYIATGDGGGAGDPEETGQSLETLLGKILRLDVDAKNPYGIPADNPFAGDSQGRPEIWAFGLRNPWRFSFDRATDALWIADVGQNVLEEVNRAPVDAAGLNYGWDVMEGTECFEPSTDCDTKGKQKPIAQYSHEFGCSITGGYVYRGSEFEDLVGGYFFGDFCSGTMWAIGADAPRGARPVELLQTDLSISSFGEDEAGELFVSDLESGRILRLIDASR